MRPRSDRPAGRNRTWLVKEEPRNYSFEQLSRDGATRWSGVKNPLALIHLRAIRKGDRILYYHTGTQRAIVGVARATTDAYVDPRDRSGRLAVVDIAPVGPLPRPVRLDEIRREGRLAAMPLLRIPRLSVMPVSHGELRAIEKLARSAPA